MREILEGHDPDSVALLDANQGVELTYGQLREKVAAAAGRLRAELGRGFVFHFATNTIESVVLYLACLDAACPVCLLEPGPPGRFEPLLAAYAPDALLLPAGVESPHGMKTELEMEGSSYRLAVSPGRRGHYAPHAELALLLTTSGSTGSPKLVRLTRNNVLANARSIVTYLGITSGERSMQSLPMHYSFGLSLINSHLLAGACVVLTAYSFLQPMFWEAFDRCRCSAFAGVPYMYETLHRLRFDPRRHPSLRIMTQAGGGLRPDLIQVFYEKSRAAGIRFFVMYGQTEATARIAYVPWEQLGAKIGCIGIAIPHGRLWLEPVEDQEWQELVYKGPNVMMGYAETAADLTAGDELGGVLHTGDLADVDSDGFFSIRGRLKRFAKLFGRRVNLEDIERDLERRYPLQAAVIEHGDGLRVRAALRQDVNMDGVALYLAQQLNVPPKFIVAETIDSIPLTPSGKKDYRALQV